MPQLIGCGAGASAGIAAAAERGFNVSQPAPRAKSNPDMTLTGPGQPGRARAPCPELRLMVANLSAWGDQMLLQPSGDEAMVGCGSHMPLARR